MHIGDVVFDLAARSQRPEQLTLADRDTPRRRERTEVEQGHGQPVAGLERYRAAVARQCADEAHDAGRRCEHRLSLGAADVHASVLARLVLVDSEDERPQHVPGGWPAPRVRARARCQCERCDEHRDTYRRCQGCKHAQRLAVAASVVNYDYSEPR
jgi:hypothetical protein